MQPLLALSLPIRPNPYAALVKTAFASPPSFHIHAQSLADVLHYLDALELLPLPAALSCLHSFSVKLRSPAVMPPPPSDRANLTKQSSVPETHAMSSTCFLTGPSLASFSNPAHASSAPRIHRDLTTTGAISVMQALVYNLPVAVGRRCPQISHHPSSAQTNAFIVPCVMSQALSAVHPAST